MCWQSKELLFLIRGYMTARLHPITIGFSTTNSWISKTIRWCSRSSVSHTYVRVPMRKKGVDLIFQAGIEVSIESAKRFESENTIVKEFHFQVTEKKWQEFEQFAYDTLGAPYAYGKLIGMLWVLGCRAVGVKVKNPFGDGDHSYICVELVAKMLGLANTEEMTPQDLLDYLQTHPIEP